MQIRRGRAAVTGAGQPPATRRPQATAPPNRRGWEGGRHAPEVGRPASTFGLRPRATGLGRTSCTEACGMRSRTWCCLAIALTSSAFADGWYATRVVSYTAGSGASAGHRNPQSALGEPARMTGMSGSIETITPFQPAYMPDQIVSIGAGGSLRASGSFPMKATVPSSLSHAARARSARSARGVLRTGADVSSL